MYIAKFQIKNYKSFLSSQEINLTPGFNVVVGQNNAGKTAFVEALSLGFNNKFHVSLKTNPSLGILTHNSFNSIVQIAFQLAAGEAEQLLINTRGTFYLPFKTGTVPGNVAKQFLRLLSQPETLQCVYQPSTFVTAYFQSLSELASATRGAVTNAVELRVNTSERQFEYMPILIAEVNSTSLYGPFWLISYVREFTFFEQNV